MIHYVAGYKYVTTQRVELRLPYARGTWSRVTCGQRGELASLDPGGLLVIEAGYAWDGPSGPAIDTPDFMGASLIHDVLYQMIRLGELPESWRKFADEIMWLLCRGAGMSRVRAWWCYYGVREGAGFAARPSAEPKERTAPLVLMETR